jgi:hypothetical protein
LAAFGIASVYFPNSRTLESVVESREFWYNTKTNKVEQGYRSFAINRIGPFSSAEEAARALEIVADRARQIAEEDEKAD